jgi:hypothetical protein
MLAMRHRDVDADKHKIAATTRYDCVVTLPARAAVIHIFSAVETKTRMVGSSSENALRAVPDYDDPYPGARRGSVM